MRYISKTHPKTNISSINKIKISTDCLSIKITKKLNDKNTLTRKVHKQRISIMILY